MRLRAVSFNIRCADDSGGNTIAERAPRLREVLSRCDADVIGLQEYTPVWAPYIIGYFARDYGIFNRYRHADSAESTPVLWRRDRFVCEKTGCFWLSDTPETESRGWDEIGCPRIAAYAVLREKATGEHVTFLNTHFGFGDACQIASARLIDEYARKLSPYPTLVTGDFNMTPGTPGYRAMTADFTDVNAATVNDLRTTYHGYTPETVTDQHIDYCFVDSRIAPVSQTILTDTVDGRFPSDHFGLLAELSL